jgi:cyclin-dependent kinase 8/11
MWNRVWVVQVILRCISVFQPSGNAPTGGQSVARPMPRQMPQQPMVGGMPRVAAGANMAAFNASQAGMAGLNPGNIPMQRGAGGQPHPHQVILALSVMCYWRRLVIVEALKPDVCDKQLRRKADQGMGMQQNPGYPQQKRRFWPWQEGAIWLLTDV